MLYLWVSLIVIPSPILIFISSEAIAIIWAMKGASPLLLALSLAIGQTIGYTIICIFGDEFCERWERARKLRAQADLTHYQKHIGKLIAWASFVGIPPVNISCLAAASIKAKITPLIPLFIIGRFSRYWIVASLPHVFKEYVKLPQWLLDM